MPTIELRTPTSFLFFVAAAVATYYSINQPAMTPFAQSAFCFFAALGPIRWITDAGIAILSQKDNESAAIQKIQVFSLYGQGILVAAGAGVGSFGITSAPL